MCVEVLIVGGDQPVSMQVGCMWWHLVVLCECVRQLTAGVSMCAGCQDVGTAHGCLLLVMVCEMRLTKSHVWRVEVWLHTVSNALYSSLTCVLVSDGHSTTIHFLPQAEVSKYRPGTPSTWSQIASPHFYPSWVEATFKKSHAEGQIHCPSGRPLSLVLEIVKCPPLSCISLPVLLYLEVVAQMI